MLIDFKLSGSVAFNSFESNSGDSEIYLRCSLPQNSKFFKLEDSPGVKKPAVEASIPAGIAGIDQERRQIVSVCRCLGIDDFY